MCSFKSSGDIQKKEGGPDSCFGNQSSSVTLNELAKKARKISFQVLNFLEVFGFLQEILKINHIYYLAIIVYRHGSARKRR